MKVSELKTTAGFTVFSEGEDKEINGIYIGDLLSWVMGRAGEGCAWLTIMNNLNVCAVAKLAEVSCVVLCERVLPDKALIERMSAEKIWLFGSEFPAYETALKLTGKPDAV